MKFFAIFAVFAALLNVGCAIPVHMPEVGLSVQSTGMPFVSGHQVVVTCPGNLDLLKVEKRDTYGLRVFKCFPGETLAVPASGWWSDQQFSITVFGYRRTGTNAQGEALYSLVGRATRTYQFYEYQNSTQVQIWDVSTYDLR